MVHFYARLLSQRKKGEKEKERMGGRKEVGREGRKGGGKKEGRISL